MLCHPGGLRLHPFGFFFARGSAVGDGARDLTDSGTRACCCEGGPFQQSDGYALGTILVRVGGFEQMVLYQGFNQFADFVTVLFQVF